MYTTTQECPYSQAAQLACSTKSHIAGNEHCEAWEQWYYSPPIPTTI